MRTVVTGAAGLPGSDLIIELPRQGHRVRANRRANSRVAHLDAFAVEWCDADLGDEPAVGALAWLREHGALKPA